MRPFDSVILTEDLPQHSIPAGTEGTIVDVFSQDDEVCAVELFDRDGNTLDEVDVRSNQMTVTLADFSPESRWRCCPTCPNTNSSADRWG